MESNVNSFQVFIYLGISEHHWPKESTCANLEPLCKECSSLSPGVLEVCLPRASNTSPPERQNSGNFVILKTH